MHKTPKGDWKANQFDWDRITSLSEAECCFSLSQQEIAIILTYTEVIGWLRRWYSETGETVEFSTIENFKNQLERKLMSGCCPDADLIGRYTEDGIYQTSSDGGITWENNPDADPRSDWVLAPPLSGTDGALKKCAAADNVTAQFNIWADNLIELLGAGTIITAIAAAIVGFIASVAFASGVGAAWGVMLFGIAAALFAEGSSSFDEAMTEEVYEDFKCILYCNVGENGQFSEANIIAILEEITDKFDGIVEHFFYSIVSTMRGTGMSNTATLGAPSAEDCGDCDCVPTCEDPDKFVIGTVTSQVENPDGSTTFTVDAVLKLNGTYAVEWGDPGSEECCCITDLEVTDGVCTAPAAYWSLCGNPSVDNSTTFPPDELGYFAYQQNGCLTSPFTISITFGACE